MLIFFIGLAWGAVGAIAADRRRSMPWWGGGILCAFTGIAGVIVVLCMRRRPAHVAEHALTDAVQTKRAA
jgi:hypothetical protein